MPSDNDSLSDKYQPILLCDISIPLNFNGPQPNAYGVEPASASTCEYGELVGDTRRGGSCNFERITLIPHCNGTHTECVGHITDARISVRACLRDVLISAVLISVEPEKLSNGDCVITRDMLETKHLSEPPALAGGRTLSIQSTSSEEAITPPDNAGGSDETAFALIVRTLPNNDHKLSATYDENNIPPYFTTDAMEFVVERGFKHLLVDLPSIDRLFDAGKLANHRIFWNMKPGGRETDSETRINSTITELIYVPNEVADGEYLLNLQIAPFESDASPSRPILFKLK